MSNQMKENPEATILIVDDAPANVELLMGILKEKGYKPRAAISGKLAIQAAQKNPPNLILLDINMPEMNGYQVCEQLKADPKLTEIPVIFISALNETMDKVKAFGVGAVDYITKPFQFEEVAARVHTHLELCKQKRELQQNYERLMELEHLRDNLTHMIIHDMRSPLCAITLGLELVTQDPDSCRSSLKNILHSASESAKSITHMVNQLLDISRLESGQMPLNKTECNLVQIARQAIDSLTPLAEGRMLELIAPEPTMVSCDTDVIRRVIENLLANGFKFVPEDGVIQICVGREDSDVKVKVMDSGIGIPPEYHQKIFNKFCQVENKRAKVGTGLGLAYCKLAIEAHEGSIGVNSEVGKGSTFWFSLPG